MLTNSNHEKSAQIRLEQVSLSFYAKPRWLGGKPFHAINQLSLSIDKQNLAIVGPSGAGKSSLIELLFALRKPSEGEVYVCGLPLSRITRAERHALCHHIQLVPQEPQATLNPYYSVREVLVEPLIGCDDRARAPQIEAVMRDVGLDLNLLDKNTQALSVGQAQRVAIARALMLSPCVLVADEPTSSLDPVSREQIISLLGELQQRKAMRLVLVTHDLDAAKRLCNEILVLDHGHVVEHGVTEQVIAAPQHATTKALVNSQHQHNLFIRLLKKD